MGADAAVLLRRPPDHLHSAPTRSAGGAGCDPSERRSPEHYTGVVVEPTTRRRDLLTPPARGRLGCVPQSTEGARTPRFVRPIAGLRCDARRSMQRCGDRSPRLDPSTIPHLRTLVTAARIRATPRSVRTSRPPWRRSGDRGRCTKAYTRQGRAASLPPVA